MAIGQVLPSELLVGSVILYLDPSSVREEFSNFLCFLLLWAVKGDSGRVIQQLKLCWLHSTWVVGAVGG